jgi:hypothetical protein
VCVTYDMQVAAGSASIFGCPHMTRLGASAGWPAAQGVRVTPGTPLDILSGGADQVRVAVGLSPLKARTDGGRCREHQLSGVRCPINAFWF